MNILIVEDDAALGEALKRHLSGMGHTVAGPAPSCSAALELIWADEPDLAFVDTHLSSETCAAVLDECHLLGIPIIVTHADDDGAQPPCCAGHTVIDKSYSPSGIEQAMLAHHAVPGAAGL